MQLPQFGIVIHREPRYDRIMVNSGHYTLTRRYKRPSYLRHSLAALTVLIAVPLSASAFIALKGDPIDAVAHGQLVLGPMPPAPQAYNLATAQTGLPDLLGPNDTPSQVSTNAAPAQSVDILGRDAPPTPDLAGSDQRPTASRPAYPTTPPVSANGPTQITINGQPVIQGATVVIDPEETPGRFLPARVQNNAPLTPAPIAGLSRSTPFGRAPAPDASGRTPFKAYAKPYTANPDKREIALVIGGLGLDAARTDQAINSLPANVTLAFAAHAPNLQNWINKARARGHEVILELPMEPFNMDPSMGGMQYVLRANVPPAMNLRNMDRMMSRAQGYFAVTDYFGERFFDRRNAQGIAPVLEHISRSGLGFLYDEVGQSLTVSSSAASLNLPWRQNQSVIDAKRDKTAIIQTLRGLESAAANGDSVIGMGFAFPETLEAIIEWNAELDQRGAALAPASYALSSAP